MKRTSFARMTCPIAASLEVVGEWWSLLVVREAFLGRTRFEEFQARLGIARNILAARLRSLTEHGVLEARPYQEHPPRFEYALTEKGRALFPVIVALMTWGNDWTPQGKQGVGLVDRETGRPLEPVLIDRGTGAAIESTAVRLARAERAEPAPRSGAGRVTRQRGR
jgi:DNA-binding HxlR family transcriptional regulator